jgi:hypothetical protein
MTVQADNSKPLARRSRTKPYIVGVANELSEYASVRVFAKSAEEAEETVRECSIAANY